MAEPIDRIWDAVCKIADAEGAAPINKLDGCWYCRVDQRWELAVNGHQEPKACGAFSQHKNPINVPPFHIYIEYNGFPAGLLTPYGGEIAAGELANAETFATALEARLTPAARGGK